MNIKKDFHHAPAPFWLLNHRLDKEEMSRQIRLMKETGVSGFFLHARDGLMTPYGSEQWFDHIKFAVEEAGNAGLKAWLYDEDAWPSGNAGGLITSQYPELAAKTLEIKIFEPDDDGNISVSLGRGRLLAVLEVNIGENDNEMQMSTLTSNVGMVRTLSFKRECNFSYYEGTAPFKHIRASTCYPDLKLECKCKQSSKVYVAMIVPAAGHYRYDCPVDNLNPECVKKYLELTHEKYKNKLYHAFGNVVPGIFTDEPSAGTGDSASRFQWTDSIEKLFLELHGRSIETVFPHLVSNLDSTSRKVRKDYWTIVNMLFESSYFEQVSEWCEKNGIMLCGHMHGEENPQRQIIGGGNVFKCLKHFQIPGYDHITTLLPDRDNHPLNFGGRLVSSAASWYGRKHVLCECFAVSPFNLKYFEMRKIAGWLFSMGINWLVPAQFHYSYDGYRKDDAGKSFFFQDPAFKEFPDFIKFSRNLCQHLSLGCHETSTAVVCPYELFMEFGMTEYDLAQELTSKLYEITGKLISSHIEFDIVADSEVLNSVPEGGYIKSGLSAYKSLIIPCIDAVKQEYLSRFDLLKQAGIAIYSEAESVKNDTVRTEIIGIAGGETENLYLRRIVTDERQMIFIFNNSPTGTKFKIRCPAEGAHGAVYEPVQDCYYRINIDSCGWAILSISGFSSLLLEFSETNTQAESSWNADLYSDAPPSDKYSWTYVPPVDTIKKVVEHWDVKIGSNCGSQEANGHSFCLLRDIVGTDCDYIKQLLPWRAYDAATLRQHKYQVEYSAKFQLDDPGEGFLLFETETFTNGVRLIINDREISSSNIIKKAFYDFNNLVIPIVWKKENLIQATWPECNEFTGIKSAVYVVRSNLFAN